MEASGAVDSFARNHAGVSDQVQPSFCGIIPVEGGFMMGIVRLIVLTFTVIFMACMLAVPSSAQQGANLANFLGAVEPAQIFPEADRLGPQQGSPPMAPAYQGDRLLGYAFLNSDFVNAVGYSGKPIHIVVGLALDGTIAGARLVEHKEPI